MKDKRNGKKLIAVCLLVLSLVLITVGTTFAFFQYSRQGTTENTLQTGTLTFVYDETRVEKNKISLTNAFPISDEEGMVLTTEKEGVFDFDIKATTRGAAINYEIYLTKESTSTLPEYTVKTYLQEVENGEEKELTGSGLPTNNALNLYSDLYNSKVPDLLKDTSISGAKTLYRERIEDGQSEYTKTFRYRMWVDNDANSVVNGSWIYNNMIFSVKVNVYAQNGELPILEKPGVYKDESGANYPNLIEGLIPVRYDNNKKSWVKADLNKKWYDYEMQEWANAVTVTSETRDHYTSEPAGTEISMTDINTMWVWIPRYEYYIPEGTSGQGEDCIFNGSNYSEGNTCYPNPGEIQINFINEKNTDASDVNYRIQPAFKFGEDELTGFWYAKFETSKDKENKLEVKPAATPINWTRIADLFYMSRNMQTKDYQKYGFLNDSSYDIHMIKNSEWASVAYLSQSKYGKYGNSAYNQTEKQVALNCGEPYTTGVLVSGDTYDSINGQTTSTTGNVTGVYDMVGGELEYVMGVLSDENKEPLVGASGFKTEGETNRLPEEKYYDLYTNDIPDSNDFRLSETACNGGVCYGHDLSETAWWYGDQALFVTSTYPWLLRGGNVPGSPPIMNYPLFGVFFFVGQTGGGRGDCSLRLVLAPIR